ncbi:MAG: LmeA family phospholipid-binding protein [Salinibacterium sp.]|nr:LmeA family phospholipid-binding protein [Salinibacterium sp.]
MAEPIAPRAEPVNTSPAPTEVVVFDNPPPPKKRRRWLGWLIALIILVVLAVIAFFVAESFVRPYAENLVREQIVQVLPIEPSTPVEVTIGPGSVILQALSGTINRVDIEVTEFALGPVSGQASISAVGVPLDGTRPVEKLGITVTVTEDNVRKLAGFLSGLDLKTIELQDGVIQIGTDLSLLFVTLPVAVDLLPGAGEGGISFSPQTIYLGDDKISVADLQANPLFSSIAGALLASRTFCVADQLPTALRIEDVEVVGAQLVIDINGDGTPLAGPSLSTVGVCPAA